MRYMRLATSRRPLKEALQGSPSTTLRKDYEFLMKDDLFSEELLETRIDYKMNNEA